MGRGSAARREAPWRRPPARRHRSARPVARYRSRRDHPIAAGIVPRPVRPHARPSAAYHGEARPPGLDDIDNDLSHGCGGDMSMPQKYPPTRHYLQMTSDNRRSGRQASLRHDFPLRRPNGAICARPYGPASPAGVGICMSGRVSQRSLMWSRRARHTSATSAWKRGSATSEPSETKHDSSG
jgi:hypothetical protein